MMVFQIKHFLLILKVRTAKFFASLIERGSLDGLDTETRERWIENARAEGMPYVLVLYDIENRVPAVRYVPKHESSELAIKKLDPKRYQHIETIEIDLSEKKP